MRIYPYTVILAGMLESSTKEGVVYTNHIHVSGYPYPCGYDDAVVAR